LGDTRWREYDTNAIKTNGGVVVKRHSFLTSIPHAPPVCELNWAEIR
jgi:hypothetical protein